jgi:hypothetical protein
MNDHPPASKDGQDTDYIDIINSLLDQIIRMKRQHQQGNVQAPITGADRKALLEAYKQLEEEVSDRKGRFLLEYNQGLRTILEEITVIV